jgi:hypothetical protein
MRKDVYWILWLNIGSSDGCRWSWKCSFRFARSTERYKMKCSWTSRGNCRKLAALSRCFKLLSASEDHLTGPSLYVCLLRLWSHYYNNVLSWHCLNSDLGCHCFLWDQYFISYFLVCPADVIVSDAAQRTHLEFYSTTKNTSFRYCFYDYYFVQYFILQLKYGTLIEFCLSLIIKCILCYIHHVHFCNSCFWYVSTYKCSLNWWSNVNVWIFMLHAFIPLIFLINMLSL